MIDAALLLPKILERAGNNRELSEAAAIIAWKRVAGEGLARHAKPIMLRDMTLTVEVADEVWKKQLQRMSAELVSRMNRLLRHELVKTIGFRVNPALNKSSMRGAEQTRSRESLPAEIISSAAEIEDPELRDRFMRAATNCIDRREANANKESARRNPEFKI
jgi:hypothetical protein